MKSHCHGIQVLLRLSAYMKLYPQAAGRVPGSGPAGLGKSKLLLSMTNRHGHADGPGLEDHDDSDELRKAAQPSCKAAHL
jgi:hypothetical protein